MLALFEEGFSPDLIIGVSVGAINGAFLSLYPTIDGAHRMIEIWRRLGSKHLFGSGSEILRGLATFLFRKRAVYSNRGLRNLLTRELGSRSFDDTAVPLVVVATILATGEARYLSQGRLVPAVLASAAVPLRFPPVKVDGQQLVDGAIADPVPVGAALEAGVAHVVIVEPGHACACPRVYDNAMSIFSQSIAILAKGRASAELRTAADVVDVAHLGLTCHADVPMTDLSKTDEMIDSGYAEAKTWLASVDADWMKVGAP